MNLHVRIRLCWEVMLSLEKDSSPIPTLSTLDLILIQVSLAEFFSKCNIPEAAPDGACRGLHAGRPEGAILGRGLVHPGAVLVPRRRIHHGLSEAAAVEDPSVSGALAPLRRIGSWSSSSFKLRVHKMCPRRCQTKLVKFPIRWK